MAEVDMNKKDMLGANIRSLRKAFGETQEQLGEILNIEKNTVSSYETGAREPGKEMIQSIAKHYLISAEELMHSDFSSTGKLHIDMNSFWENTAIILPAICTEEASKNEGFMNVYRLHRELYTELQSLKLDSLAKVIDCIEGYENLYENEVCQEETAANLIAMWYLLMLMLKMAPDVIETEPAALRQIMREDDKIRKTVENIDKSFAAEARELLDEINDEETRNAITEYLKVIKKSGRWSYLGDYYLALGFFWNLVENDVEWGFNRKIGMEMLYAFASVDNFYAARFIEWGEKASKR